MKKLILASAIATSFATGFAHAEDAKPENEVSYNISVVNDYRFRGISQTRFDPAVQGGAPITPTTRPACTQPPGCPTSSGSRMRSTAPIPAPAARVRLSGISTAASVVICQAVLPMTSAACTTTTQPTTTARSAATPIPSIRSAV